MFKDKGGSLTQRTLCWTARGLSILSTAVLLIFLFGEPFVVSRITMREWAGLALFPVGLVVGFVIAWRKEFLGGAISIGSLLVFCPLYVGHLSQAWAFFVFAIPGFLFLVAGILSYWRKPTIAHS